MSKGNTFCVYGLHAASVSPRTIRYIGKARSPSATDRLRHHIWLALRGERGHKFAWIRSVLSRGDHVVASVLVIVGSNDEACRIERALIARLPNLTNATEGGEGRSGYVMPSVVKERIRNAQKGRPLTVEHRQALSKGAKGKSFKCSARARANMKAAWTDERRAAFAESRRGKALSSDHRLAITRSWERRKRLEALSV